MHGSTIATNMLIERNGPPVGLVATEGFRDVLYFRDAFKADRYNIHLPRPAPVVDRHLRIGVRERVLRDGTVEPRARRGQRSAPPARRCARPGSRQSPSRCCGRRLTRRTSGARRTLLAEELPAVPILLPATVLPEHGEWVRTSATAVAYVYPVTATYLRELESWLAQEGLRSDLLVMQINGGCANVEHAWKVAGRADPLGARRGAGRGPLHCRAASRRRWRAR